MKAVGFYQPLPIDRPDALVDLELPDPLPGPRDLLVEVKAISVNPIDTKVRKRKRDDTSVPRVLGWDAAGTVRAVGRDVTLFRPGDGVYYAGSIDRPGADSALHLVDERIAGHKPASLDMGQAAALPLTAVTAWESLFDRLRVNREGTDERKRIVIIGGAGGVGSIAIQLAKRVAGLTVIATASREASRRWCLSLGADHVIDHTRDLGAELAALGEKYVDYVLCSNDTSQHWRAMAAMVAPQGHICALVDTTDPVDLTLLKPKSATLAWESMFTRSSFQTPDMVEQHRILEEVARLVDQGIVQSTVGTVLGPITAENLRRAHAQLESGRTVGKIVLEGF